MPTSPAPTDRSAFPTFERPGELGRLWARIGLDWVFAALGVACGIGLAALFLAALAPSNLLFATGGLAVLGLLVRLPLFARLQRGRTVASRVMTLPLLSVLAAWPFVDPVLSGSGSTLIGAGAIGAAIVLIGVVHSLVVEDPFVRSHSRSALLADERIEAIARHFVDAQPMRTQETSSRRRSSEWVSRGYDDQHLLFRDGDVRIQIYPGLVQIWHRTRSVALETRDTFLRALPDEVTLEPAPPDRHVLFVEQHDPATLGRAAARLVTELHSPHVDGPEPVPLEGRESPRDLGRERLSLSVYDGARESVWALRDEHLHVRSPDGEIRYDLARPFRLLVGVDDAPDAPAVVVTIRQRDDAAPNPSGGGLTTATGSRTGTWRQSRLAVPLSRVPAELAGTPRETASVPVVADPMGFVVLWRELYWRASRHDKNPPSLPSLPFAGDVTAPRTLRRPDRSRSRRVFTSGWFSWLAAAAAVVGCVCAASVFVDSFVTFPVWEASVSSLYNLTAGTALLAVVLLLLGKAVRARRTSRYLTDLADDAFGVMTALDPAISRQEFEAFVDDSDATLWRNAERGRRLDVVMANDRELWATASAWPLTGNDIRGETAEQVEIHVRGHGERARRLRRALATAQMTLLRNGVPARCIATGESTTLALRLRYRAGDDTSVEGGNGDERVRMRHRWHSTATVIRMATEGRHSAERIARRARDVHRDAMAPVVPAPPDQAAGRLLGWRPGRGLGATAFAGLSIGAMVLGLPQAAPGSFATAPVDRPNVSAVAECPRTTSGNRASARLALSCVMHAAGSRRPVSLASPAIVPEKARADASCDPVVAARWGAFLREVRSNQGVDLGTLARDSGVDIRPRADLNAERYAEHRARYCPLDGSGERSSPLAQSSHQDRPASLARGRISLVSGINADLVLASSVRGRAYVTDRPVGHIHTSGYEYALTTRAASTDVTLCSQSPTARAALECVCRAYGSEPIDANLAREVAGDRPDDSVFAAVEGYHVEMCDQEGACGPRVGTDWGAIYCAQWR